MGDRAHVIIASGDVEDFTEKDFKRDPKTTILYTHWNGRFALHAVRDAIKSLGSRSNDPKAWVKYLKREGFEKVEGLVFPDHADIVVVPEERLVTFLASISGGAAEMPDVSFEDLKGLPDKVVELVHLAASDADFAAWLEEQKEPYTRNQQADRRSSFLVASIPLILAGVGGTAAYFRNRQ